MSRLHLVLKVSNVLVYLFFLSSTVYTVISSRHAGGDDPFSKHETYITPAAWVNYAWSLIHFLLLGFVVSQWFEEAQPSVVNGVGWHFVIATLLNAAWLHLWNNGHVILAFLTILLTASSVSFVFYNLEAHFPANVWYTKLFIHAPFSLWHGWVVYVSTLTLFAAFTHVKKGGPDTLHIIISILGLIFLGSTAVGYVEFKKHKGDVIGALVLAWGLYAIFYNQHNPWIHWVAFAEALVATLYPARPYLSKLVGRRTSEQAPLLG